MESGQECHFLPDNSKRRRYGIPIALDLSQAVMLYRCFHCQKKIRLTPEQLGSSIVCPHCEQTIDLPKAEEMRHTRDGGPAGGLGRSWINNSVSGLVSVVAHITLLLCFALVTCEYRGVQGEAGEEVRIGELPLENLTDGPAEELLVEEAQPESQADDAFDEMLEIATPLDAANSDVSLDLDVSLLAPSGSGGATAMAALAGGGGTVGEGASFMGVHAKGTRFCIIADHSGSMEENAKLDHVKEEILETLSSMGRQGRFQLVFFNSRELSYPQPGWRHPRRERAEVANWMQGVNAEGGTYPTPAFRVAFQLVPRPDAIFFMTDGQFPAEVVEEIAALNRGGGRRVVIHTISFMDTSSEPLMKRIASDSGGKYRHVSGF